MKKKRKILFLYISIFLLLILVIIIIFLKFNEDEIQLSPRICTKGCPVAYGYQSFLYNSRIDFDLRRAIQDSPYTLGYNNEVYCANPNLPPLYKYEVQYMILREEEIHGSGRVVCGLYERSWAEGRGYEELHKIKSYEIRTFTIRDLIVPALIGWKDCHKKNQLERAKDKMVEKILERQIELERVYCGN